MTPIEPTVHPGERLMTFAENQPEYIPLPVTVDAGGVVTTEWELTAEELSRVLCGGRIRLCVHTFDPQLGEPGHYLQPVSLDVLEPTCVTRES